MIDSIVAGLVVALVNVIGGGLVIRWLVRQINAGPPASVLEIGCGARSAIREGLSQQARWEGIDVQETYYGQPSPATRIASVSSIPFPDESFDYVVADQSIEHWYEFGVGLRTGLLEVARVLRLGGTAHLNAPMAFHGHPLFRRADLDGALALRSCRGSWLSCASNAGGANAPRSRCTSRTRVRRPGSLWKGARPPGWRTSSDAKSVIRLGVA